jgi:hypothetical protein
MKYNISKKRKKEKKREKRVENLKPTKTPTPSYQ